MNTTTTAGAGAIGGARGILLAGLALAAMVTGGALATTAAAEAAPQRTPPNAVAAWTVPDRVPHPFWETPATRSAAATEQALAARSWIKVRATVDGARIRRTPVNGAVIGLIPYGAQFGALCTRQGSDGWLWGWVNHAGRKGWVRADLWTEVAPLPQVPSCDRI